MMQTSPVLLQHRVHIRRITRLVMSLWSEGSGDAIHLGKGHPNPSLLPLQQISDAVKTVSATTGANVSMMQYGPMQGAQRLRTQLADWMSRSKGHPDTQPRPDNILVTTGAGPALSLITQLFTKPGDLVFVDSPGYFLSYYTFIDCGLTVVNVPTDSEGLRVDVVEKFIAEGKRPSLIYTVPIGNNPTGVSMSEDRKKRLVELSHQHKFKIIADEVYQFLYFKEGIPTSLFEFDDATNPSVFAINSFSKLLGPGLRLGWVCTHDAHMKRLLDCGSLQSGGGFNPFMGEAVTELLDNGFVLEHVQTVRDTYKNNCEILCDAVDKYVKPMVAEDESIEFNRPSGGFFCFLTLPQRFDTDKLLPVAKDNGVIYFAGRHSSPDKKLFTNCIRLCFAFQEADAIVEGVKRLGEAIRVYDG